MVMPLNLNPPAPTDDQLRHVLAVSCGWEQDASAPGPTSYEPLLWLLRSDVGNPGVRRTRRSLYLKLVRDLEKQLKRIYEERLSSNGPWEFPEVYGAIKEYRRCIRRMRWCALMHFLHLPSAGAGSMAPYTDAMQLLR